MWQPTAVLGSFAWAGATESMLNYVELDRAAAELGERIVSEGARVAQDAGMQAEPLAVKATGPVWKTILEVADEPRRVDDRDRFAGAHRPALDAAGERVHRCRPSCRPTDACHPLSRRRRCVGACGMIAHPAFSVEPWSLCETELDLDVLDQAGSLFALANGHIGLRGNLDEGEPPGLPGTYLNGFYEQRPLPYAEAGYGYPEAGQTVVNVTNGKIIRLLVDDEPFDLRFGELRSHERTLDFRAGVLRRHAEWRLASRPSGAGHFRAVGLVRPAGSRRRPV